MGLFQHPHLTRGIVKTAKGAFIVSRGLVDVPDELGESLGWRPADTVDDPPPNVAHVGRQQQILHGETHRSHADDTQEMTGARPSVARRRKERS
jgi:hypothetical protein